MNDNFHEILETYKNKFYPEHLKNTTEYFDDLLKKSGVNAEENARICSEIADNKNQKKQSLKKSSNFTILMWISIIATLIIIIILFAKALPVHLAAFIVPTIALIAILSVIIYFIVKEKKKLAKEIAAFSSTIDTKTSEARKQMEPLNSLYESGISNALLTKTIPLIQMDKNFKSKRYMQLALDYGFIDYHTDKDTSVLACQSGELSGNPFFFGTTLATRMIMETYTGSVTYTWTERVSKDEVRTMTDTLTAEIQRPAPAYSNQSYLYYGNDAAENLSFSRSPGGVHKLSEKELENRIKKVSNSLKKQSEKAIKAGGNMTLMNNMEFEALFNSRDRNNEAQFRLMFTPLAQVEMVKLLTNKNGAGPGDDFYFNKQEKINQIQSYTLDSTNIKDNPLRYVNYNLKEARDYFIAYNMQYLRAIFFSFAPLLTIPLYQQTKPHKFIYKDVLPSYFSRWHHEAIANDLPISVIKHPESRTQNILKTNLLSSYGNGDIFEITAYGYKTIPRVEIVRKMGRDGKYHNIPINWTEYIDVAKTTKAMVVETDYTYREYVSKIENKLGLTYLDNSVGFVYEDPNMDLEKTIRKFLSENIQEKDDKTLLEEILEGDVNNVIEDISDDIKDNDN